MPRKATSKATFSRDEVANFIENDPRSCDIVLELINDDSDYLNLVDDILNVVLGHSRFCTRITTESKRRRWFRFDTPEELAAFRSDTVRRRIDNKENMRRAAEAGRGRACVRKQAVFRKRRPPKKGAASVPNVD